MQNKQHLSEYLIDNFNTIKIFQTSKNGYPLFTFGIPRLKIGQLESYGSYYTAFLSNRAGSGFYTDQLVFYSENTTLVNTLNHLISVSEIYKNSENSIHNLKTFLKANIAQFHDLKKNPIATLNYWETIMFNSLSDPKAYNDIQQSLDIGVCYLIRDDNLYTFRTPTQFASPNNPALKGYYTKPIHTQEQLASHTKIVNELFDKGLLEYEVMLSGAIAQPCIENIHIQNANLPTAYEYEQICILKNYAKLQKYPIQLSVNNKKQEVILSTHYGVVNVIIAQNDNELLLVSTDNKKDEFMNLTQFVNKFYYDKNKEKVDKLLKKFKHK